MAIFFDSMAILFQLVIKISLDRTLWNIILPLHKEYNLN